MDSPERQRIERELLQQINSSSFEEINSDEESLNFDSDEESLHSTAMSTTQIGGRTFTVKAKVDPAATVVTAEHTLEDQAKADAETLETWRKQATRGLKDKFSFLDPSEKAEAALAETSSLMNLIAAFREQLAKMELETVFVIQDVTFDASGSVNHTDRPKGDLFTEFSSLTPQQVAASNKFF